jgi:hypothetical protein
VGVCTLLLLVVYSIIFIRATLLDVCVLLLFTTLYIYRLNYFNITREIVNNRRSYVMFRDLEWITLDLLCLYSNAVPQDLEQSIRNSQPVAPVRSKKSFQFIQQGPSEIFDHFDSVLFPETKLQDKVMSYTFRHRLVPRHERQLLNCPLCVLKQLLKALRYSKVLSLC